jgi:hypothetical protein
MSAINPPESLPREQSWTPAELGPILKKSHNWVRSAIKRGELGAIAIPDRAGKLRYVVLRRHLDAFISSHQVTAPKPAHRKRRLSTQIDFFP